MNKRRWVVVFLVLALAVAAVAVGLVTGFANDPVAAKENSKPKITVSPEVSGDCLAILGLRAGPVFYEDGNNTGFALFHNGNAYLIDSGIGTPQAFTDLGVTFDQVKGLFFTHYHFDHTAGYADILTRGYMAEKPNNNLKSLNVYGPPGLADLTTGIMAGYASGYALHNWAGLPYPATRPNITNNPITPNDPEALALIPVFEDDDIRVEAVEVDHDEAFGTCYGYRFTLLNEGEETGKVVVFSGDRANYNARRDFSPESPYYAPGGPGYGGPAVFPEHPTNAEFQEAFNDLAYGATILVHEAAVSSLASNVANPNIPGFPAALYWHLVDSHTDVNEVPVIAKEANVGALVLNHYGDYGDGDLEKSRSVILSAVLKANAKVGYKGTIIAPLEMDVIHF